MRKNGYCIESRFFFDQHKPRTKVRGLSFGSAMLLVESDFLLHSHA
jgi:hypothetical protein